MITSFKARLNPPEYTIIDVGIPRTKSDLRIINEELARASSDTRVQFEKGNGYRVSTLGTPILWGGGLSRPVPLSSRYIVVPPSHRDNIIQTNHIQNFTPVN